jgi:hypothetical protein
MLFTTHYFGPEFVLETSLETAGSEDCTWKQGVWFFPQGPLDLSSVDTVTVSVSQSEESRELFVSRCATTTK